MNFILTNGKNILNRNEMRIITGGKEEIKKGDKCSSCSVQSDCGANNVCASNVPYCTDKGKVCM